MDCFGQIKEVRDFNSGLQEPMIDWLFLTFINKMINCKIIVK